MMVSHWSSRSAFTTALWKVVFNTSDNPRCSCLELAFVIVEALVPDPLDPTRLDLLLVFTGKANLNASSQAQVTRGGSFQLFCCGPLHEVQRSWFG